jgi:hypothetical protein
LLFSGPHLDDDVLEPFLGRHQDLAEVPGTASESIVVIHGLGVQELRGELIATGEVE